MPPIKNISFSHVSKFRLSFPFMPFLETALDTSAQNLSEMTLYCDTVTLPGITITPETVGTPYIKFNIGSNDITFGQLTITYHVDELFDNYERIYKWLMFMKNPEVYKIGNTDGMVDGALHIFTNNDNTKFHFRLVSMFPISTGQLAFDKQSTDGNDLVQSVTFSMDYYQLVRD